MFKYLTVFRLWNFLLGSVGKLQEGSENILCWILEELRAYNLQQKVRFAKCLRKKIAEIFKGQKEQCANFKGPLA